MSTLLLLLLAQSIEAPVPGGLPVRVVDARGTPLAEARVTVVESASSSAWLAQPPNAELLERGRHWITRLDGQVEVAVPVERGVLVARSRDGAQIGLASVRPCGEEPLELQVRSESAQTVAVVTAGGAAASGAWLALEAGRLGELGGWFESFGIETAIRWPLVADPTGRITLEPDDRFALAALAGLASAEWSDESLRLVTAASTTAALPQREGATRLTLPPLALLELELHDRSGALVPSDAVATLQLAGPETVVTAHGVTHLGARGRARRVLRLPLRAGRGQLLGIEAGWSVVASAPLGERRFDGAIAIEAFGEAADAPQVRRLVLQETDAVVALGGRHVDAAGGPLGDRDVELPLDRVVAGRVVDEFGAPLAGVSLTASALEGVSIASLSRGVNAMRRPLAGGTALVSGSDGSFAFYGRLRAGTAVELTLHEPRFGTRAQFSTTAGALDERLALLRNGAIAGSLRLAKGVDAAALEVRFGAERCSVESVDGVLHFESNSVPPGRDDVAIRHRGPLGEAVLALIRDVDVEPARRTLDPRLEAIDLRSALVVTTLSIVDAAGAPVAAGTLAFDEEAQRRAGDPPALHGFSAGRFELAAPPERALLPELTVRAPGFRTRRLTPPSGTHTIELTAAAPIAVTFSAKGLRSEFEWQLEIAAEFHRPDETERNEPPRDGSAEESAALEQLEAELEFETIAVADRNDERPVVLAAGEVATFLPSCDRAIEWTLLLRRRQPPVAGAGDSAATPPWREMLLFTRLLPSTSRAADAPFVIELAPEELAELR